MALLTFDFVLHAHMYQSAQVFKHSGVWMIKQLET